MSNQHPGYIVHGQPITSPRFPGTEDRGKASSPSPDHVARANEHQRRLREASARMGRSIRAAGDLFGQELAHHLALKHEDLGENAGEAIYHLEQRIREIEDREAQAIRALGDKIEQQRHQLGTLYGFAAEATGEFRRRAVRSGKPVPDFVSAHESWLFQTNGPF